MLLRTSIVCVLLCSMWLSVCAQQGYELLIPWGTDTSCIGVFATIEDDHSVTAVTVNSDFDPNLQGIPIDGWLTWGTGLVQIAPSGTIAWKRNLTTSARPGLIFDLYNQGRIPATTVLRVWDNWFVPYSLYTGWQACDSTTASLTYWPGLLSVSDGGQEETRNEDIDTVGCLKARTAPQLGLSADNELWLLYVHGNNDSITIAQTDTALGLLALNRLHLAVWGEPVFDAVANAFIAFSDSSLVFLRPEGVVDEFPLNWQNLWWPTLRIALSESHIALMISGTDTSGGFASQLMICDRTGSIVAQHYFENHRMRDVAFVGTNTLLVVSDNALGGYFDSLPLPVNVSEFDLQLNKVSERNYGFPFVNPARITTSTSGEFVVTGSWARSIDAINGEEEDQLYVLKGQGTDLIPTGIHEPEINRSLSVSPNPTTGPVTVSLTTAEAIESITVLNALGRVVLEPVVPQRSQQQTVLVDLAALPTGLYLVRVQVGREVVVSKVVKTN